MVNTAFQIQSSGFWPLAVELALSIAIPLLFIYFIYLQFQKMIRKTMQEEFQKFREEQGKQAEGTK